MSPAHRLPDLPLPEPAPEGRQWISRGRFALAWLTRAPFLERATDMTPESGQRRAPAPAPAVPEPTQGWQVPLPYGETEAVKAMGTTGATLLGGFSLAAAAVLVTAERQPPLGGWALVSFVVSAAAFVFSVQFTSSGLGYAATPEERLMWHPRARTDPSTLARVERVHRMDARLRQRYFYRARLMYRVGLLGFLTGMILLCIPNSLDWPRIVAAFPKGRLERSGPVRSDRRGLPGRSAGRRGRPRQRLVPCR